jgi:hypothetical protein
MPEPGTDVTGAARRRATQGWGTAVVRAVLMLVVSFLAFAIVPTWLLDRLAERVTPTGRDLILVAWWMVALIGCSWLFVALQGRER